MSSSLQPLRSRRRRRIRAKVSGTAKRPRVSVFKSNTGVYAQLIDDEQGHTLAAASSHRSTGATGGERVAAAGRQLAEAAQKQGVKRVVFDRGGYSYTGRIKLLADSLRQGGLEV